MNSSWIVPMTNVSASCILQISFAQCWMTGWLCLRLFFSTGSHIMFDPMTLRNYWLNHSWMTVRLCFRLFFFFIKKPYYVWSYDIKKLLVESRLNDCSTMLPTIFFSSGSHIMFDPMTLRNYWLNHSRTTHSIIFKQIFYPNHPFKLELEIGFLLVVAILPQVSSRYPYVHRNAWLRTYARFITC